MVIASLPSKPKEPVTDLREFLTLVYGREKIGKTTLFSQWPDVLFLSTEPGSKGLRIYESAIGSWKDMRDVVKLLENEPKRFKTIVIDTADRAYDMCLDFVCDERGIEYPGTDDSGEQDFGKSWRAVKQEFMDVIHRIIRTGRGVCFTSHATESEVKTRAGQRYTRIFPSMSGQARKVIEALVDIIMYADYMKDAEGNTIRVLMCHGDETIFAGHRKTAGAFPDLLPLLEKGGYQAFLDGFNGRHPGVDPKKLNTAKTTTKTAAEFITKLKTKGGASLPVRASTTAEAAPKKAAARRRE